MRGIHVVGQIGEADFIADQGAAASVTQCVQIAAGHHSDDCCLSLGRLAERLHTCIESGQFFRRPLFLTEDGSDHGRVIFHTLNHAFLIIHRGVYDRSDLRQFVILCA